MYLLLATGTSAFKNSSVRDRKISRLKFQQFFSQQFGMPDFAIVRVLTNRDGNQDENPANLTTVECGTLSLKTAEVKYFSKIIGLGYLE
jgi:hypothetical protein